MFSPTHDRYILVCVELLPKKFQNNKSNLPKNPICIFLLSLCLFLAILFDGLLLGMPGLYLWRKQNVKIWIIPKWIWFRREFSPKTMKIWRRKKEGIRGTIQIFFYLILITVSLYWWIKLNIFLDIDFLNFLVVFSGICFNLFL